MTATRTEIEAAFRITAATTDAIREAGELPAGVLYATLMGRMDLAAFEKMVALIVNTGLVEKRGDLLRWVGPMIR